MSVLWFLTGFGCGAFVTNVAWWIQLKNRGWK